MNVGAMQRKLSQWATQDEERKFYGPYDLLMTGIGSDWLRLYQAKYREYHGRLRWHGHGHLR